MPKLTYGAQLSYYSAS